MYRSIKIRIHSKAFLRNLTQKMKHGLVLRISSFWNCVSCDYNFEDIMMKVPPCFIFCVKLHGSSLQLERRSWVNLQVTWSAYSQSYIVLFVFDLGFFPTLFLKFNTELLTNKHICIETLSPKNNQIVSELFNTTARPTAHDFFHDTPYMFTPFCP